MIIDFLNSLFGSERGQTEQQETILAPVVTVKASNGKSEPGKYDSDIEALTGKRGLRATDGFLMEVIRTMISMGGTISVKISGT